MDLGDLIVALLGTWLARGMADRSAELAPTGIYKSPLYHAYVALLLALFALIFTPMFIRFPPVLFRADMIALAAAVVAAFFVRRALKWRYPI
jgi:hypothetical protein